MDSSSSSSVAAEINKRVGSQVDVCIDWYVYIPTSACDTSVFLLLTIVYLGSTGVQDAIGNGLRAVKPGGLLLSIGRGPTTSALIPLFEAADREALHLLPPPQCSFFFVNNKESEGLITVDNRWTYLVYSATETCIQRPLHWLPQVEPTMALFCCSGSHLLPIDQPIRKSGHDAADNSPLRVRGRRCCLSNSRGSHPRSYQSDG